MNLVYEGVEQRLGNGVDVLRTSLDFAVKILDSDQLTARLDRTVTAKTKACVHTRGNRAASSPGGHEYTRQQRPNEYISYLGIASIIIDGFHTGQTLWNHSEPH